MFSILILLSSFFLVKSYYDAREKIILYINSKIKILDQKNQERKNKLDLLLENKKEVFYNKFDEYIKEISLKIDQSFKILEENFEASLLQINVSESEERLNIREKIYVYSKCI